MESYREEVYGPILFSGTRVRTLMMGVSLVYAVLAALGIIFARQAGSTSYGLCALWVGFALWRIHAIHRPVILVCEKALLVSVPFWNSAHSKNGISDIFCTKYMPVSYDSIVGFSNDWSILYLGEAVEGGMVELPVQCTYLSTCSKEKATRLIIKQMNKEESE